MYSTICVQFDTSRRLKKKPILIKVLTFSALLTASHLVWSTQGRTEVSHPDLALEAVYTEALLHYNKREFNQAASLLDQALKIKPDYVPALEMRALTLKTNGDDHRAIEIYQELTRQKPQSEQGPYHFELATLYQRAKNLPKMKYHLQQAILLHFNEVPSHLLLGNLEFSGGDFAAADDHFQYVRDYGPPELRMVAHYYLGLVNFQMSYGTVATAEMLETKKLAEKNPQFPGAGDILKSSEQMLTPFKKSRWFFSASTVGQYDTNVAQIPIGISNPVQLTGKSTGRMNISAGAGWMDAPLNTVQMVFNYQGSFNKNTNSNTQNYEFFTHSASIYANFQPLSFFSGGLKSVGSFVFQNQLMNSSSSSYIFGKSSASADFGPFLKVFLSKSLQLQSDFYFRPQVSYLYPSQNGNAFGTRFQFTSNTVKKLFNPSWTVSFEKSNAAGSNVRYLAYGAGISNVMRLTGKDTLTQSVDFLYTNYFDSDPKRIDVNLPIRLNWSHYFSPQWMLICDVTYINNFSSTAESFSYNRLTSGLGVSWTPL